MKQLDYYLLAVLEAEQMSSLNALISKINAGKPVYILLSGGFGAGKSHVIEKVLGIPKTDIVDIDEIKVAQNLSVPKAINEVRKILQERMAKKQNIVQQGTAANLQSTKNKIILAKKAGYVTILFRVERDIEEQIESIYKRAGEGGRNYPGEKDESKTPEEQRAATKSKVEFKNQKSLEVFQALKDLPELDYVITYNTTTGKVSV